MKRQISSVFRAFAASASVFWFAGCETEADDAATNVPPAVVEGELAGTNRSDAGSNALPAGVTNITNVTNEQTVILNKVDPVLPSNLDLSKGVEEIIKLAQSGMTETVMLLFIEKSEHEFDLDAAEIVYLNDIGVPQTVIAAMLNHDGSPVDVASVLSTNKVEVATAPEPLTGPQPPPAIPASGLGGGLTPQPAPQVVEVTSNYVADPNYQAPVVVEQQPVVVQQPVIVQQPAVTQTYFYSSLAPYGSWIEVPDYGWCWQPTIAVRHYGWRPYLHGGRWLHSNHGWYWHSDYSWGWAPFHYGRWYSAPHHGWVWVPGNTWGPSWVTWRYSGSYCGWAPLPPRAHVRPGIGFSYWDSDVSFGFSFGYSHHHYTFLPTRRFCDRRPVDHVIPTEKTVNIYKDSTVVNNYIVGNNNTIINQGIGRDRIATHVRSEIPSVRVQEAPRTLAEPDRIHRRGHDLVVYRPTTPPAASATPGESRRGSQEAGRFGGTTASASANTPAGTPSSRFGSRNESTGIASRPSGSRSQIAARSEAPAFAPPAPVRPEPAPAFTPSVRSSRAVQEARSRTEAPLAPASTGQAITSSRFGNRGSGLPQSSSRFGNSITEAARPATPAAAGVPSTVTRGSQHRAQPSMPASISGQAVPGNPASTPTYTSRGSRFNAPTMPPSISGQQVPGASSTSSSIGSRPASPAPATAAPSSRFGNRPASPPSISGQTVPGAPVRQTPSSRFGNSELSRQSVPGQPSVQQQSPALSPRPASRFSAPAAPNVSRSERFSQPSAAQAAPPPVLQPRTVTPIQRAPVQAYTPPANSSVPSSRFGGTPPASVPSAGRTQPGSISGGRFSAPPAAPAPSVIHRAPVQSSMPSRPAPAPATPTQSGRGRIEIGR